jgi:multiple sugar transport system permease protein
MMPKVHLPKWMRGQAGRESLTALAFLAPYLVIFVIWQIYPIFYGLWVSFTNLDLLHPNDTQFVGLANYSKLFTDELLGKSLLNTLYFTAGSVVGGTVLALALALAMNTSGFGARWLKWICFIPFIMTTSASAIVWKRIYAGGYGILNQALSALGLPGKAWLENIHTAMPAVIVVAIWNVLGYRALILLTGIQNISSEIHESAMLDGAGYWARLRYITLPLLRPVLFFVLTMAIISSFQVFSLVMVLTGRMGDVYGGNPLYRTLTIVMYIYAQAFKILDMGYGAALSWLLFAIILIITLVQMKVVGWEE